MKKVFYLKEEFEVFVRLLICIKVSSQKCLSEWSKIIEINF